MRSYSILVAEDDRGAAERVRLFLQRMGHEAGAVVSTGEAAVEEAAKRSFDLAILDIRLQGEMHGVEAAKHLIGTHTIPVVLLTGQSADPLLEEAAEAGVVCLLKKPILYEELAASINIAIRQWERLHHLNPRQADAPGFFEHAGAGMYRCAPDGALRYANTALAHMLGYDSAEELQALVKDVAVQYYVEAGTFGELSKKLDTEAGTALMESQVFGRDGQVRRVSESCHAVRDAQGNVRHIDCVVQDVTDARRLEEELQITLDMLRQLVASIEDMVFLVDMDHRIILCNEAFARHTGMDADALVGRSVADVFPEFSLFSVDAGSTLRAVDPADPNRAVHFTSGAKRYHMSVSPYHSGEGPPIGAVYVCRQVSASAP